MTDLLKAEFYKLSRSRSFWGITLFSLLLGSVLLLDSIAITDGLVNASLFNTPLLYFLSIVFGSLFVGADFAEQTLHSFVSAGHKRSSVLFAKTAAYQAAGLLILGLPLVIHLVLGILTGNGSRIVLAQFFSDAALLFAALIAMGMLPLLFAFLFRDIGKTFVIPMVLYFLMIFALNSSRAAQLAVLLPIGQIRLISLNQLTSPTAVTAGIDGVWIFLSGLLAYGSFCRCDLK